MYTREPFHWIGMPTLLPSKFWNVWISKQFRRMSISEQFSDVIHRCENFTKVKCGSRPQVKYYCKYCFYWSANCKKKSVASVVFSTNHEYAFLLKLCIYWMFFKALVIIINTKIFTCYLKNVGNFTLFNNVQL